MVAVTILGILATVSVSAFKTDPVADSATKTAALIQEARRLAITNGPVRADVVAALRAASFPAPTARSYVIFSATAGGQNVVTLRRLIEGAAVGTYRWENDLSFSLPSDVVIPYLDTPDLTTQPRSYVGAGSPVTRWFFPTGSASPMMVYLGKRNDAAGNASRYSIRVLQLSGLADTAKGW